MMRTVSLASHVGSSNSRRLACSVIFLATLAGRDARAEKWEEYGPSPIGAGAKMAGRMVSLAPHPTNPDLLYAGAASGGLWKWDGDQWTPLTDHMPIASIGALALDPNDPDTIYAGTGEPTFSSNSFSGLGIYRSKDGGQTWEHFAEEIFGGRSITQIRIAPDTGDIFASMTVSGEPKEHPDSTLPGGLYRSSDGGVNWEPVTGLPKIDASDFAFDPENPKIIFAGLQSPVRGDPPPESGLYRSNDGGTSWKKLTDGLPSDPKKIAIAISPVDSSRIYVLAGGANPSVYVSRDGGDTWEKNTPSSFTAQIFGHYDLCALADSDDVDTAYFGGVQMVKTTDGGRNFSRITPAHTDIQRLAFDAGGRLIVAQDGGIHVSNNKGSSWSTRNDGLATVQIYAGGAINSANPEMMVGGLQDNGTVLRTGDLEWDQVMGADGGCNASHPDTPNVVFSEIYDAGNIYRSDDSGRTFKHVGSGIDSNDRTCFMPTFAIHPGDPDVVFYGTQRLWKTSNRGGSWQAISSEIAGDEKALRSIAVSNDGESIYVTTTGMEVHVSHDGGVNFKRVLTEIHGPRTSSKQIRVAPWDGQEAYLAVWSYTTPQVQVTQDGGTTWTSLKGDLIDVPVNTVEAFEIGGNNIVIAGSDRGIFATCNQDGHWRKVSENFPTVPVVDVQADLAHDRLVAFTFGRGAWVLSQADEAYWRELCEEEPDDSSEESSSDSEGDSSATDESGSDSSDDDSQNSQDSTDAESSSEESDVDSTDTDANSSAEESDGTDDSTSNESGEESEDDSRSESDDDDDDDADEDDLEPGGCACASTPNDNNGSGLIGAALLFLGGGLGSKRRNKRKTRSSMTPALALAGLLALSACDAGAPDSQAPSALMDKTEKADATSAMPAGSESIAAGLRFAGATRGQELRIVPGRKLVLSLDQPTFDAAAAPQSSPDWTEVLVQRFTSQSSQGDLDSVVTDSKVSGPTIEYTLHDPGVYALGFCTQNRAPADISLIYCNKTVLRVLDRDGRLPRSAGNVAGKSGEPVEIRALMSPAHSLVGSVMPVRFYVENQSFAGQEIVAIRPDLSTVRTFTTGTGIAHFNLDMAGKWVIRVRTSHRGNHYVADLVFEVLTY